MPLIDNLPSELLLEIFFAGCETEFDNYNAPASIYQAAPPGRRLKPFVKTASRVCNRWKGLIYSTPKLWVITLLLNLTSWIRFQEQTHQLTKLLDTSSGSEIELWFKPRQHPSLSMDEVNRWLKTRVFRHYRQQIRAIFTESLTEEYGALLLRELGEGHWDALRILALRTTSTDCILPATKIIAPKLHYLEINEASWKTDECLFDYCSSFKFVHGTRPAESDPWTWPSLKSHVVKLARSLTCLKIEVISTRYAPSPVEAQLDLPLLAKLAISTTFYEEVVDRLNMIHAQNLAELKLKALVSIGPRRFHNYSLFSCVRKLALALPNDCLPLLLEKAPVDCVSDLIFSVGSTFHFEGSFVVRFTSLRNLFIDSTWAEIPFGFFNMFDFSAATDHVRLSCSLNHSLEKVSFPYLKKISITSIRDLIRVKVPTLQHLNLSHRSLDQDASFLDKMISLQDLIKPLLSVRTLQLSECIRLSIWKQPDSAPDLLHLLPSLKSLVFEIPRYHNWLELEECPFSSNLRLSKAEKQITDLSLTFPSVPCSATNVCKIARDVKRMAQQKKVQGHPLESLQFSLGIPSSELTWWFEKELKHFKIVPYRDEFSWVVGGNDKFDPTVDALTE